MIRLNLALICVVFMSVPASVVLAQDGMENQGGTVRGRITNTTPEQNPIEGVEVVIVAQDGTTFTALTDINGEYERLRIPAGRYLISIYKDGYGDRLGKPVTVVNGGDHYVPLKMTKKENIFAAFKGFGFLFWIVLFSGITAVLTFYFTKRAMQEKFEADSL